MGLPLPFITPDDFFQKLEELAPCPLANHSLKALYAHFLELRRWQGSLSLIGPGTVDEVLERHYGESLAALSLLPSEGGRLLDVGSGAGFPGFVLAAAHPSLEVFLAESRQRKWAFLSVAARRASVPCTCLQVRVKAPLPVGLPEQINFVTARALKLSVADLEMLTSCLSANGRILLWVGGRIPRLPMGLAEEANHLLHGGERRRIVVLRPREA